MSSVESEMFRLKHKSFTVPCKDSFRGYEVYSSLDAVDYK